jgi:hypothetical protein
MTTSKTVNAVKGRQGFQRTQRHPARPTPLDAQALGPSPAVLAQRNAINAFTRLARHRPSLPAGEMEHLGIFSTLPIELKEGEFEKTSDTVDLTTTSPVFTRQASVSPKRVLEYVEMMRNGDTTTDIQVTDIVPGGGHWHLNGLHRLTASRILGRTVRAELWR